MESPPSASASLTAALIRRVPPPSPAAEPAAVEERAAPVWRDDLRLFAITWAAGFLFFLAFIA